MKQLKQMALMGIFIRHTVLYDAFIQQYARKLHHFNSLTALIHTNP